jgi:hypothetical protein
MPIPSIFRRSEDEQAPEVEVQGDDIVIRKKADDDGPAKEVRTKMPKTKWA